MVYPRISHNDVDVDPNVAGLQTYAGTTVQYSGSASDPNGNALTWRWIYTINGGSEVVFQSGSGTVTPITFVYEAPMPWAALISGRCASATRQATSQSQLSVGVEAPPSGGLTFAATSGTISTPFVVSNGAIYPSRALTGVTNGGRAAYSFTVTNAGVYVILGAVNAPDLSANSFYVNIDAEPQDPAMIWQIPLTTGFPEPAGELAGHWDG